VLDGEVVVLRNGRPDFDAISGRLTSRRLANWAAQTSPVTSVAFDLLEFDGRVLTDAPHTARRDALEGVGLDGLRWALTMSDGDGEAVWAATRDLGLEGVVCKDPHSAWVPRRTKRWLKCKHWRHGTFPVMGWAASTDKEPAGLVVGSRCRRRAASRRRRTAARGPRDARGRDGADRRPSGQPGAVARAAVAAGGAMGGTTGSSRRCATWSGHRRVCSATRRRGRCSRSYDLYL
jgi:hypothetical protein